MAVGPNLWGIRYWARRWLGQSRPWRFLFCDTPTVAHSDNAVTRITPPERSPGETSGPDRGYRDGGTLVSSCLGCIADLSRSVQKFREYAAVVVNSRKRKRWKWVDSLFQSKADVFLNSVARSAVLQNGVDHLKSRKVMSGYQLYEGIQKVYKDQFRLKEVGYWFPWLVNGYGQIIAQFLRSVVLTCHEP